MIALITILIILGVILITAVLLFFLGNASIRIVNQQDKLRVLISICGIQFTVYPDKKDKPQKPKNLAQCRNPEKVLKRELRRRQKAAEKAARKKIRDAKKAAKRAEKKIGIPKQYCPVPNLKENLEMVRELAKKLVRKTRGKVRVRINKLHIRVATNDAAHTALLYGVVIQLVSYLIGYVERNYTSIERHDGDLAVEPDYTTSECSASIDLLFTAKIWRAVIIIIEMVEAYDAEKKRTYRKAALREREQQNNKPGFDFKNILTRIRKDHSLWKTNLLSRK